MKTHVKTTILSDRSKVGKMVKMKHGYLNCAEEADNRYTVVEDNGDRLLVQPTESDMYIVPTELVRSHMVEVI